MRCFAKSIGSGAAGGLFLAVCFTVLVSPLAFADEPAKEAKIQLGIQAVGVPMLSQLPHVGGLFKNVSVGFACGKCEEGKCCVESSPSGVCQLGVCADKCCSKEKSVAACENAPATACITATCKTANCNTAKCNTAKCGNSKCNTSACNTFASKTTTAASTSAFDTVCDVYTSNFCASPGDVVCAPGKQNVDFGFVVCPPSAAGGKPCQCDSEKGFSKQELLESLIEAVTANAALEAHVEATEAFSEHKDELLGELLEAVAENAALAAQLEFVEDHMEMQAELAQALVNNAKLESALQAAQQQNELIQQYARIALENEKLKLQVAKLEASEKANGKKAVVAKAKSEQVTK